MDLDTSTASDDEPGDFGSTAEVLQKFEEVWVNEKLAPELLSYQEELVDCLIDQIQHMEGILPNIKKEDFRLTFHKMEIDRIRYVLNSYLRTRLNKIEKYAPLLLKRQEEDPESSNLMSEEEKKFAMEFISNMSKHFSNVALSHMPINQQVLPLDTVCLKPELNRSVFVRVKKETIGFLLQSSSQDIDDEIVDLIPGSQHLVEYRSIAPLIKNESVCLI